MEIHEAEHIHHHRTGRSWLDVLLGVSAVLISFFSLFLAISNGKAMERLVQANSWPFVQVGTSNAQPDGTPHIHLYIVNKGVGPARIESLEVTYKGMPMSGPREMLNTILGRTIVPQHPRLLTSTITHQVLASKERIPFFDVVPEGLSAEDYAAINGALPHLNFHACYCSVFDECWLTDIYKSQPAKIKACPVSSNEF